MEVLRILHHPQYGIIWDDRMLRRPSRVADIESIRCSGCASRLGESQTDSRWCCVNGARYYCTICFNRVCRLKRSRGTPVTTMTMPRSIGHVMRQIEAHPQFQTMEPTRRGIYDIAVVLMASLTDVVAQTAILRQIWLHLYNTWPQRHDRRLNGAV